MSIQSHPVAELFERRQLTLISGPCVIESYDLCKEVAQVVQEACLKRGIGYIFKASFDKANRTSIHSYRGPGLEKGLDILGRIREDLEVPVLTDIHEPRHAEACKDVVDVIQIPAFLCRQTDLLVAAAKSGIPTNIKKGQFLAPADMKHAVAKFREAGGDYVAVTERGSTFGYNNLVVDMRGLREMAEVCEAPVIFDATHSVQKPGAGNGTTGGDRTLAPLLARAAVGVGIDGLFCEVHPTPEKAKSDGPNSLTFELLDQLLDEVSAIDAALRAVLAHRERAQTR